MPLIDTRTTAEYQEEHAPSAINIPVQELYAEPAHVKEVIEKIPKTAEIKVYCASGGRAELAKQILESRGFSNVENLGGLSNALKYTESQ